MKYKFVIKFYVLALNNDLPKRCSYPVNIDSKKHKSGRNNFDVFFFVIYVYFQMNH